MKILRKRIIFFLLIALFFLSTGCSKKNVEGVVKDPFGKGVEGVMVQVLKSQFKTMTNGSGKYSVDFAPGSFTIQFSKPGYTTLQIDLTIQEKSHFPAETITLYPIPKEQGIFYVGDSELLQLHAVPVVEMKQEISWPPQIHYVYSLVNRPEDNKEQSKKGINIKAGKTMFIDTYPKPAKLFKLGNGSVIQDVTSSFGGFNYHFNGVRDDTLSEIGKEKLLIRTVDLEPGNYAWCGTVQMFFGGIRPDKGLPCFPFTVIPSAFGEKMKHE